MKEQIKKILDISDKTYYNWKNQNRPIISLLEKYFTKEDIKEFLETEKIQKLENITFIFNKYLSQLQITYLNSFKKSQSLLSDPSMHNEFRDFYFNFLTNFGKIDFSFNNILSLLTHYLFQYQTQKIKENLKINKINEKLEDLKFKIDEAITSSKGEEKEELKNFKKNLQDETQKDEIVENIFSVNKRNFERLMLHFFTFNTWNDDMYYFLELVKKDEFDYFINSKNDELLYQGIGYLVYSLSHNLDAEEKLQIIYSTFHYFIFNRDLISSSNIKEQILKRLENNESFSEIDKEVSHKYITSPFHANDINDLNSKEIIEVEEEISIEDFFKKYQNK